MENKKSGNGILIVLAVIIILLVVAFPYVQKLIKGTNNNQDGSNIITEATPTPIPRDNKKTTGDYEIIVYKDKTTNSLTSANDLDDSLEVAFKIRVNSSTAKVLAVERSSHFVLYDDDGIKIYDVLNNTYKEINIKNDYLEYNVFLNEANNRVIGIGFKDKNDYVGYYNVDYDKTLYYDKKYTNTDIDFLMFQISDDYISFYNNIKAYFLSSKEEKEIMTYSHKNINADRYRYWSEKIGDNIIYVLGYCPNLCNVKRIYSGNLKEIYNGDLSGENISLYNDSIYFVDKNIIKKYKATGEFVTSISGYNNIKGLINNYVIHINNGFLTISNIDNSNDTKEIVKWNDEYYYDAYASSFFSMNNLESVVKSDEKEGINIVIYYSKNDVVDSNGNYGMKYCYTSSKEIIEYPIKEKRDG